MSIVSHGTPPADFSRPRHVNAAKPCRWCTRLIRFCLDRNGRWLVFNQSDGSHHVCPQKPRRFRRP